MKLNTKGLLKSACLITLCLSTFSCKNTFDLAPENALQSSQAYQNVFDADAAIIGLYGKLVGVADRYMVLNELRADLEDVTVNADKYLRQVNEHSVTADNPWANPKPFYEIIINCNDVMKNFDVMLQNKRMSQTDYNIRYSDVGALRCWLYLQVGIHYGSIPYITDPLESITAAQDETKYPKITFDALLDKLIATMEGLPTRDFIPSGTSILNISAGDGYTSGAGIPGKMFVDKNTVLGELYLWKNNYPMAAKYFKKVLEYSELTDAPAATNWYGVNTLGENPRPLLSGSHNSGSLWNTIFTAAWGERFSNYDNYWLLPFDSKFSPVNPFIALYAPDPDKYKIKPSAQAISNWNKQVVADGPVVAPNLRPLTGTPGDIYRGLNKSYKGGANPSILKLIPNYNSSNPFATTGKWIIFRATELHLNYMEAVNRDGRDKLAYALLNIGVNRTYTPRILNGVPFATTANFTNIMQSNVYLNAANVVVPETNPDYYFDARDGGTPAFNAVKWSFNVGLRGRVNLVEQRVDSTKYFDMTNRGNENKPVTDRPGLTLAMEDLIINEQALEQAFEGERWPDLLRIALRREKETPGSGRDFLKNKIAAKFTAAGLPIPAGVAKLGTDVASWYLPFKMQ